MNLTEKYKLPLFLHCRNSFTDFHEILWRNKEKLIHGGVVHSFDGTIKEALQLINDFNLFIGINGCSLKTVDNLKTVAQIPIERLLIETDCPWCSVRTSHAGKMIFCKT